MRLYSCQNNASSVVRDPAKSTADLWEVVRQGLADARMSTGPLNRDHELWQKAEHLVKCNTNDGGQGEADLNPGASTSDNPSGAAQICRCSRSCSDCWSRVTDRVHAYRLCLITPPAGTDINYR